MELKIINQIDQILDEQHSFIKFAVDSYIKTEQKYFESNIDLCEKLNKLEDFYYNFLLTILNNSIDLNQLIKYFEIDDFNEAKNGIVIIELKKVHGDL